MTPEVVVHHPIPHDLRILLENLAYTAGQAAESYTCFTRQSHVGEADELDMRARGGGVDG